METKRIKITIDKKGNPMLECVEGFAGENCLAQTKAIENVLGGIEVDGGKTGAYYEGDSDPISISIN
jgi:hypothetical protein